MEENSRKKLLLPLISAALMLIAFTFLFIESRKNNGSYSEEKKVAIQARQEAEINLFLNDLKKYLNKSFLSNQKSTFYIEENKITGRKVVLIEMDESAINNLHEYFKINKFETIKGNKITLNIEEKDTESVYYKSNLMCKVIMEKNGNISVNCGYNE